MAALALPSAVFGQRCYDRKQNTACRNPEKVFKIVRDIDKDECKYLCTTYPGSMTCYGYEYNYPLERCELHSSEVSAGKSSKDVDCYIGRKCDEDNSKHSATYTKIDGKACKAPSSAPPARKIYGVNSDECKRICTRDPTSENPDCVGFEYGGDRNQPCELYSKGKIKGGKKKKDYNCWVKN
uniref:Apple domain-containing protein n=1 Tax=Minutocellus polymorphus TaxID=265543 RepID=A0A7S0FJH3_9STRA